MLGLGLISLMRVKAEVLVYENEVEVYEEEKSKIGGGIALSNVGGGVQSVNSRQEQ
jgi:hypothetical protein